MHKGKAIVLFTISLANLFLWKHVAENQLLQKYGYLPETSCYQGTSHISSSVAKASIILDSSRCQHNSTIIERDCSFSISSENWIESFSKMDNSLFFNITGNQLAKLKFPNKKMILVGENSESKCNTIAMPLVSQSSDVCFAVVSAQNIASSSNIQRYIFDEKVTGKKMDDHHPEVSGFFRKVASQVGRSAFQSKFQPLLSSFAQTTKYITSKLANQGILPGNDVIVMVGNDGEVDLFMNFICSCHANHVNVSQVVLFAGSK